ncbi:MAG: hypothetical protein KAI84_20920 [Gammaproteobacteria bacterium]|nr:hypothetical protein [Gammaproteobacteria bacterium]
MSIHIVPIGLDSPDRFVEGFRKFAPSKVIFLMGIEQTEIEKEAIEIKNEVKNNIGKHVEVKEHTAELFRFSDAIKTLANIIIEEKKKDDDEIIYINISSSTKVITQASYMAASLFKARIYYVPAEKYLSTELILILNKNDELKNETVTKFIKENRYLSMGVKEPYEIPVLKMRPPNKDELNILEIINKNEKKKFKSLKFLVEEGLGLDYSIGSNRNKYSQIVKKLEKNGFVTTNRSGREKGISLTESGKVIAEISNILPI